MLAHFLWLSSMNLREVSAFHAHFLKKSRNSLSFHGQFLKNIHVRGITFSRTKIKHSEPASYIASSLIEIIQTEMLYLDYRPVSPRSVCKAT